MSAFMPGLPEMRQQNATKLPRALTPASLARLRHVYHGATTSAAGGPVRLVILAHIRANHVKHALRPELIAELRKASGSGKAGGGGSGLGKSGGDADGELGGGSGSRGASSADALLRAAATKVADSALQMQRMSQQHMLAASLLAAAFPGARLLLSTYEDIQHILTAVLQNLWRAAEVIEPPSLYTKAQRAARPVTGGGGVSKRQAEDVGGSLTPRILAALDAAFEARAGRAAAGCLSEMLRSRGPEDFLSRGDG